MHDVGPVAPSPSYIYPFCAMHQPQHATQQQLHSYCPVPIPPCILPFFLHTPAYTIFGFTCTYMPALYTFPLPSCLAPLVAFCSSSSHFTCNFATPLLIQILYYYTYYYLLLYISLFSLTYYKWFFFSTTTHILFSSTTTTFPTTTPATIPTLLLYMHMVHSLYISFYCPSFIDMICVSS